MLLFVFVQTFSSATADPFIYRPGRLIPRADRDFLRKLRLPQSSKVVPGDDFMTSFYNQTLDHFTYRPESYTTFKQKYLINSKYWSGTANSTCRPIFAYLGDEAPIEESIPGFLEDNAPSFKALLLYIEVRKRYHVISTYATLLFE